MMIYATEIVVDRDIRQFLMDKWNGLSDAHWGDILDTSSLVCSIFPSANVTSAFTGKRIDMPLSRGLCMHLTKLL
jgi:hypothetical protein